MSSKYQNGNGNHANTAVDAHADDDDDNTSASQNSGQDDVVVSDNNNQTTKSSSSSSREQQKEQPQRRPRRPGRILSICGKVTSFSVHSVLFVLFLAWVAVYCIQILYNDYFVTIVQRAERTDDDLLHEFTYYARECSLIDLTADTSTAYQLVVDSRDVGNDCSDEKEKDDKGPRQRCCGSGQNKAIKHKKPADRAVDSVMLHGAVMIPSLLQDSTIDKLRDFVVRKNNAVLGTSAEYPVSQGRNRISYGIEATEDEAVTEALKELHDHTMLKNVVSKLVGPNPALSEITAITAHYGAGPQAWHSDTKADGNAVLWGRTYEHSYSLFIPLQDTTGEMGPTDLCPGTHYCADDNLEYLCEQNKIGLHQIRGGVNVNATLSSYSSSSNRQPGFTTLNDCDDDGTYQNFGRDYSETVQGRQSRINRKHNTESGGGSGDGVWKRGDAVLLNQQVWHRGAAHNAEGSPERIVFIVSFLGRPTSDDPRQLARGTYFHMKWNMWGHTWRDMADSAASMARPWSILRCLHLWKPHERDWGYDLFTSAALRIGNQQLGCEPGDLERFVSEVMVPLGTPEFLHGRIDTYEDEAWLIYFEETIRNFYNFLKKMNTIGYLLSVTLLSLVAITGHCQGRNGLNIVRTEIRRTVLTHGPVVALAALTLHSVRSSNWAKDILSGKTLMRPFPSEVWSLDDPTVSDGNTVIPRRFDVLIGSRYDSPHIGMYSHWLGYHYGNRLFDHFVGAYGGKSFRLLPSNIAPRLVKAGIDLVENVSGQFLQQDYRFGTWLQLNPIETESYVNLQLVVGRGTLLNGLLQEINFLYDHQRFGVPSRKRMPMSWQTQRQLDVLARNIFSVWLTKQDSPFSTSKGRSDITMSSFLPKLPHETRFLNGRMTNEGFHLFDEVEYRSASFGNRAFLGNIVGVNKNGGYNVAFYSQSVRRLGPVQYGISSHSLQKRQAVTAGGSVLGNFNGQGSLFPGKVMQAWPDGAIDVLYDDNDTELVYPGMYFMT